jgi:hypothetical protein
MDLSPADVDEEGYPLPSAKMICEKMKTSDPVTLAREVARWAADAQLDRVKSAIRGELWFTDRGAKIISELEDALRPNIIKKALSIMESVDPGDRIVLDPRQHVIITNALKSCLSKEVTK